LERVMTVASPGRGGGQARRGAREGATLGVGVDVDAPPTGALSSEEDRIRVQPIGPAIRLRVGVDAPSPRNAVYGEGLHATLTANSGPGHQNVARYHSFVHRVRVRVRVRVMVRVRIQAPRRLPASGSEFATPTVSG
jgi:hypothetical protein